MIENEGNEAPVEETSAPVVEAPAPVVEEAPVAPVEQAVEAVSNAHTVLKEIEDGLEALAAFPENIVTWLRDKLAEVRSHL